MRIIETRRAPNPRRVRIFLAEKGVTIPFEEQDLMTGSLKSAEFTALNPWQQVPVLIFDDGRRLCESVAICRYFEELQPNPPLMGSGPISRAETEMWQRRVELGLLHRVAQVFRHLHPKMAHLEVPQVAEWGEANKSKADAELRLLDKRLANVRYIAGEDYSIADITALVAIDFMKPARLELPGDLVNLKRWYDGVSQRPSASA
jgi:glutathione S-transferase